MDRKLKVTTTEDIKKIIDEYSNTGGGDINFTPVVGDPLVDKYFWTKLNIADLRKIKNIWTYTNGLYLNRFDPKEFLLSGITRLSISTYLETRKNILSIMVLKNIIKLLKI